MSDAPLRGTSSIRNRLPVGPYRRTMPRVVGGSWGGGRFLMGEVPMYDVLASTGQAVSRQPPPPDLRS